MPWLRWEPASARDICLRSAKAEQARSAAGGLWGPERRLSELDVVHILPQSRPPRSAEL